MAEQQQLPWLYPCLEDADSTRLGLPVFRPFVPISLVGPGGPSLIDDGLIDTGSDAILASDHVADYTGLDLDDHEGETIHAVAGTIVTARYKTVALRLHQPDGDSEAFHEWEAPVGFIGGWQNPSLLLLGSVGFLDRWTVTVSRSPRPLPSRAWTCSTVASGWSHLGRTPRAEKASPVSKYG